MTFIDLLILRARTASLRARSTVAIAQNESCHAQTSIYFTAEHVSHLESLLRCLDLPHHPLHKQQMEVEKVCGILAALIRTFMRLGAGFMQLCAPLRTRIFMGVLFI